MKTIAAMAVIAMVLVAFLVAPVAAANADNDLYTSKYADIKPDYPTTGSITGAVRCHNNLLTTGVTITDPAGIVSPLELRNDGTFDINGLAPGKYVINIADGNGGQPEQATVTVQAGYVSYLENELLGHAVSPADEPVVADVITVERAQYGMMRTVIDRQAVPGQPEVNHTISHPAVQLPATYSLAGYFGPYTGYAKQVNGNSPHDFTIGGQKYQIVGNYGMHNPPHGSVKYLKTEGTIIEQAHTHIIVDSPAVPAVTELSHVEGSYIDVTAQVQQAIDGGAREFVFNNAMNPGGIVNVGQTAVIVAIADPAVGQVKSVAIQVTANGVMKSIDTMEYETITI